MRSSDSLQCTQAIASFQADILEGMREDNRYPHCGQSYLVSPNHNSAAFQMTARKPTTKCSTGTRYHRHIKREIVRFAPYQLLITC